jgi:hypothetical protein
MKPLQELTPVRQQWSGFLRNRFPVDQGTEGRFGEALERRPLSDLGNRSRAHIKPWFRISWKVPHKIQ